MSRIIYAVAASLVANFLAFGLTLSIFTYTADDARPAYIDARLA